MGEAVGLATAALLKLSYYDLKRRLLAGGTSRRNGTRAPVFVEVPVAPLAPGGEERGTVELVQAGGARLILRFEGHYHGWMDTVYWSNHPKLALACPDEVALLRAIQRLLKRAIPVEVIERFLPAPETPPKPIHTFSGGGHGEPRPPEHRHKAELVRRRG